MSRLKLLFVEDNPQDVVLAERVLKKADVKITSERVESLHALEKALDQDWDLIVSDFHMPGFTAHEVLKKVREKNSEVSIIVISGALGEEAAVAMMRAGASDYLVKENLDRLPLVIAREVKELDERRARKRFEKALKDSEEQRRHQQEWLEAALNLLPTPMFFAKAGSGAINFSNDAFLRLSGDAPNNSYLPEGHKLLTTDGKPIPFQDLPGARAERGEEVGTTELLWQTRRDTLSVRVSAKLLPPMHGHEATVVATVTDITDLKQIESQLKQASEAKSRFLANMSHEIRTPLAAILGFANLLKDSSLPLHEREQFVDVILRNGKMLSQLVNDILDLSKIESGHMELESLPVNIPAILRETAGMFSSIAEQRGLKLVVLAPRENAPLDICSDPTRLKQILMNLIGNAIKFTPKGSITVSYGTYVCPTSGKQCAGFRVDDTGIGIPEDKHDCLFQQFSQTDASMSRKYGGTGLGLSLSKSIANALSGDLILLESVPGKGSSFLATFEAVVADNCSIREQELIASLHDHETKLRLEGVRILVVEDSLENQFLLKRYLTSEGAVVEVCNDGESAVSTGSVKKFDLILMDVQLPVMDGYTATKTLRSKGIKIPIVALTAHALAEERAKSAAAGCNSHLTKPIDKIDLIAAIRNLLHR